MTTVLLDKAKLLFNLNRQKEAKDQIFALLRKEPQNEKLWVHLHLYTESTDSEMSKQALFKAYDINPASALVLNCLMRHYLSQKQVTKFFHALQVASKLNNLNPNVLSLLFVLNALLGVSTVGGAITQSVKSQHLLESINLAQSYSLKEIKDDLHMVDLSQRQMQIINKVLLAMIAIQGGPQNAAIRLRNSGLDSLTVVTEVNEEKGQAPGWKDRLITRILPSSDETLVTKVKSVIEGEKTTSLEQIISEPSIELKTQHIKNLIYSKGEANMDQEVASQILTEIEDPDVKSDFASYVLKTKLDDYSAVFVR